MEEKLKKRRVKEGKERWRDEEKTVIKRMCVNPNSSDVSEEFSPMDESESFGDSCYDSCGDSCGFSVCVPAVSSCGLDVTNVSVSLSLMSVLGDDYFLASKSEFVEPHSFESDVRSFLKVKEA